MDTYAYDPAGNTLSDQSYDGTTTYGYDAGNQITEEDRNASSGVNTQTAYTYDHNGNRLTKSVGGQTDTYQAGVCNASANALKPSLARLPPPLAAGLTW